MPLMPLAAPVEWASTSARGYCSAGDTGLNALENEVGGHGAAAWSSATPLGVAYRRCDGPLPDSAGHVLAEGAK
jgi:hypothetical protein